jgi:hypothetical protein
MVKLSLSTPTPRRLAKYFRRITPFILNLGTRSIRVGTFVPRPPSVRETLPRFPLNRRLGEPYSLV